MAQQAVKPIPDGFHTLTPFMVAENANNLISFLERAFDAKIVGINKLPDGKVMHAELQIGDSRLMMSDASERYPAIKIMLYVYVEDIDTVYKKAIAAGGTSLREPTNEFYGDRSGGVLDPSGNQWWIATHVEDISPEEMQKREEEFRKQQAQ